MIKKRGFISILTALSLALSMQMSASAALPTASLVLTTEASATQAGSDGIAKDSFENDGGAGNAAFSGYPNNADYTMTSDVFRSIRDGNGFSFGEREEGNQVLEIFNVNGDVHHRTRSFMRAANQAVRFSYDIRFVSIGTTITLNRYLQMVTNNAGGFTLTASEGTAYVVPFNTYTDVSTGFAPEINKWYKVVAQVGTDGILTSYFIDADTGEILATSAGSSAFAAANASVYFRGANFTGTKNNNPNNETTKVQMDNAELIIYNPSNYLPEMTTTSADGDALPRNIKLTFGFDLPVKLGTVALKQGEITVNGTNAFLSGMDNTLNLTYPGLLERGKEYTVSFDGFTSKDDTPISIGDVTFTTEDLHSWNDVLIDSVTVNSVDNTKTDITFNLSEKYSYTVFSGSVLAALYRDGQMIGVDMLTLNNQNVTSAVTKSFTLGTSPAAGDKVMLIQVDTVGNILPLASGEITIE